MRIFDAHCDTISEIYNSKEGLLSNKKHISLDKIKGYFSFIQTFALWTDEKYISKYALLHKKELVMKYLSEMDKNKGEIKRILCGDDITDIINNGGIGGLLSLEGIDGIETKEDAMWFIKNGVKIISFTWNGENNFASGVNGDEARGLTDKGKEFLRLFEENNVIIDVSHLNDKSFWDVSREAERPFIATHSNSRKICSHKRNLTDEQFLDIIKRGGMVSINICPMFLSNSGKADINDIIKHIEHFLSLGGENNIGLGLDLDGVNELPFGINDAGDIEKILNKMANYYTNSIIEKISFANYVDFFARQQKSKL